MPVRGGFKLPANRLEFAKVAAQRRQSLGQVRDPGRSRAGLRTVGFLKLGEIARDAHGEDADHDRGLAPRQLALGVVLLVGVHRAQARPVDRHHVAADQAKGTTDGNEALAPDLDRAGIVMAEVGDGLKSGTSLPVSHISSILRSASRSSFRLEVS